MTEKLTRKSFEELFRTHYPTLCAFAKKFIGDPDDCKDIVHNVFINLWTKRQEIDSSQSLKPYLFKSVHNRCLNFLRDKKRIVRHDLPNDEYSAIDYSNSQQFLEELELDQRIQQAITRLPERCRKIFEMSRFEEMKYAEIAKKMGIGVKAVEAQMTKALKLLRSDLSDYIVMMVWIIDYLLGYH